MRPPVCSSSLCFINWSKQNKKSFKTDIPNVLRLKCGQVRTCLPIVLSIYPCAMLILDRYKGVIPLTNFFFCLKIIKEVLKSVLSAIHINVY